MQGPQEKRPGVLPAFRFDNHVQRRLACFADPGEAPGAKNFFQTPGTGLGAQGVLFSLVDGGGYADHGGKAQAESAPGVEIVFEAVPRFLFNQHQRAVAGQKAADVGRDCRRVAHFMKAVEEQGQIVVSLWDGMHRT